MTDAQKLALIAYIHQLLPIFRLSHWVVQIEPNPPNEGSEATINFSKDRYISHLRISREFWTLPPETQRNVITHELLHIHHTKIDDVILSAETPLGSQAFAFFWKAYSHADEYTTDALAAVLAPFLPLPDLPKEVVPPSEQAVP